MPLGLEDYKWQVAILPDDFGNIYSIESATLRGLFYSVDNDPNNALKIGVIFKPRQPQSC